MGEPERTALVLGQILQSLREITADLPGSRNCQLIGQARRHIGFVDDTGNFTVFRGQNHRHGHEAALGKYHIRLQFFHGADGFAVAFQDLERIREVFQVEIPRSLPEEMP